MARVFGSYGRFRGRPSAPKRLTPAARTSLLNYLDQSPHARFPALNRYKVVRDKRYKVFEGRMVVLSPRWFLKGRW